MGVRGMRACADALSDFIARIAVQRVDMPGRWFVISVDQVAYAFLGSAATHGVVDASWAGARALSPAVVYVRTVKGGLFRAAFALEALRRRLDRARFVSTHRLVIVNVDRLVELDFGGRISRIGVMVGAQVEFLPVSRRRLRSLRTMIGLPKRVARPRPF
jgi:LytTr DNA-binding domain